jgi:diguanylate cyclase (GGDEF)-like protein/PAS domain S-box-containing protein
MNYKKTPLSVMMLSTVLIAAILGGLYLGYAFNRYKKMAESQAVQLAESVASLIHVEHIEELSEQADTSDARLVEESLVDLVEVTDSIYYAYILKQNDDGSITVSIDSSAADSATSRPTRRNCEETANINKILFDSGRSLVTQPIKSACGEWIRALVPIFSIDKKSVIAVFGISYSADEWNAGLWKRMIPDFIVVACLQALMFTILNLLHESTKYKEAERSRQESERSKSVFFSQLPGMAYRCKNDPDWTMEFVSEGSYELTGYKPESLIWNRDISYNDIISPGYRDILRAEWDYVLSRRKRYRDEYEIITKNGERKWVMELGQGIYDADGNVVALEGIVLDMTEPKKKDLQIAYLREHDFLTGLYNRNYLLQEKEQLDRGEFLPLSVAICDIDGLRVINNAYGHEEGDHLIIKTAQLIKNCLRDEYVFGHTGGGEFMILMPNTDAQAAEELGTAIKNSIDSYNRVNKNALYAISLSIGHSTKEREEQDLQTMLKEADEYLRRNKMINQNSSHSAIVASIMATLYAKSQETEEHGQRLGRLSLMTGEKLGLSQTDLDDLQLLSKLHDIGKIGIEDNILNKPSELNDLEWEIMNQHSEIGYRIAKTMPQLEHIAEYILYHHERWDGLGYPAGLKGEEIPVVSRVLAIADAFDAMTRDRVYRKALSKEDALREIEENAGTQFDPSIAKLFVRMLREEDGA